MVLCLILLCFYDAHKNLHTHSLLFIAEWQGMGMIEWAMNENLDENFIGERAVCLFVWYEYLLCIIIISYFDSVTYMHNFYCLQLRK